MKSKRYWAANSISLAMVMMVAVTIGCKAPAIKSTMVQSQMPHLAPSMVGPMACPHCGLLCGQGCSCRPDPWNAGYHPTCWSYIDVEPCRQQPCGAPCGTPIHAGEVLPGSVTDLQPGMPTEAQAVPSEALPQPVIPQQPVVPQQPPREPQPPMGEAPPVDDRQGRVPGENRQWMQATRNRVQQIWDQTAPPAAWYR